MLCFKFTSLRLQTNEPFSSDWKKIKQNILVISQNFNTFEGGFKRYQDASVRNVNYMICTREKLYSPVWYIARTHSFRGA